MSPEESARNLPPVEKQTVDSDAQQPSNPSQPATTELTKEEQWALFEKELKEADWGHQPC